MTCQFDESCVGHYERRTHTYCMCQMCRRCGGTEGVSEIKDAVPTDSPTCTTSQLCSYRTWCALTSCCSAHERRTSFDRMVHTSGGNWANFKTTPPPPKQLFWDVFSHRVLCGIPNYNLSFQTILFPNLIWGILLYLQHHDTPKFILLIISCISLESHKKILN